MSRLNILTVLALVVPILAVFPFPNDSSAAPKLADDSGYDPNFNVTWVRTDFPVLDNQATRTWIWGPKAIEKQRAEEYVESPDGLRTVVYFDKSRMEVTNPNGDRNSIWFVTNGLLVVELITGNLQLGNDAFEQHSRAVVNVAGDANDPNGPTYTTMSLVLNQPPRGDGELITQRIDRAGNLSDDGSLAAQNVHASVLVPETNHRVAQPFWDFMNATGTIFDLPANQYIQNAKLFESPYFATGFPVSEAYWADVLVGGESKLVLIQCFQRRCLTYTPSNSPEWRVEAGNVGLHYREWRYVQVPAEQGDDPNQPIPPTPPVHEIIYQSSLGDWATGVVEGGEATYQDNAYRIRVDNDDWLVWSLQPGFDPNTPEFNPFDNAAVSVDVRLAGRAPTLQDACLRFRQDAQFSAPRYVFCIDQDGYTQARYDNWTAEGDYIPDILLEKQVRPGTNVATEWNRLGVIMDGHDIWFLVNGNPVGKAEHDGIGIGIIGLDVTKGYAPGSSTVFKFRNIEVRALDSTGTGGNGVPAAGGVIAESTLADWTGFSGDDYAAFVSGGTFHIQVTGQNGRFVPALTADDGFGDFRLQVDVRMVTGDDGEAEGCLVARSDATEYSHAYAFCIASDGQTVAVYEGVSEGTYFSEVLLDYGSHPGTLSPGEWNTLEIAAKGNQFWFLVNGVLQGSATHTGPPNGSVGVLVTNYTSASAEFEFTNLVVRSVQ